MVEVETHGSVSMLSSSVSVRDSLPPLHSTVVTTAPASLSLALAPANMCDQEFNNLTVLNINIL